MWSKFAKITPGKFTGKRLCHSFFFDKVARLSLFFNKETLAQEFSCQFCEISKDQLFYRTPLVAISVNIFMNISEYLHEVIH